MNTMINLLSAAGGAAPEPPIWLTYLPFVGMIAIFWFLILRPQMRKQKEQSGAVALVPCSLSRLIVRSKIRIRFMP